ncbi:hypothetical protein [Streptomyces sp. NPDC001435]|uniref:hypothetical protein n=1 Tax=unclassified Streptomyces TaxID=2593676 RepID=UPI0036952564
MTRTTPARPLDIEARFPELADHRKSCTRLHPRPGTPDPFHSSIGGPFLWPADEPWPTCREAHPRDTGRRIEDIHEERRVLDEAWRRSPETGPTEQELERLRELRREHHVAAFQETSPVPLVPLAQLRVQDVPDLVVPEGHDLLQVLWCPFSAHGRQATPGIQLCWRRAADCAPLLHPPLPDVVGDAGYVPEPCVLHPEQVVEHEYIELLSESLRERVEEWEEENEEADGGEDFLTYEEDFSIAPGWKVGGYATWGVTGPYAISCASCGASMELLLAINSLELGGSTSWVPLEDRDLIGTHGMNTPTQVRVGRGGSLNVFRCSMDLRHDYKVILQ